MKRCTNCNKEYDDDKVFCPECGIPLVAVVGTNSTATPSNCNGNLNMARQPIPSAPDMPWYSQWRGTILAVIGLIIEWEWTVIFGLALIGIGFNLGRNSPSSESKAVTMVLLVIGIIIFLIWLFV